MKDGIKILWKYIRQNAVIGIAFLLFVCIFAGIFFLYDLEVEAVIYAGLLCASIAIVAISIHFYFYYKRHKQLLYIYSNVELLLHELPAPKTLMEQDYQDMLKELAGIRNMEMTQWKSEQQESLDFYTAWVHQIKAPIAAMRLILQAEDSKENQELLSELFRVEQYTNMVLGYFRLGSSVSDFVFQEYPLDSIIRSMIRKFASQFIRKKIQLKYEGTSVRVLTDEKWLTFILEQLISNAIKYTEGGCITISVEEDKVLSITDTGIGIAKEDLPRIFEKGFTGYNGRSDKKATGLGLYLCKTTADKLSHRIQVESEIGVGSCFRLYLAEDKLESVE